MFHVLAKKQTPQHHDHHYHHYYQHHHDHHYHNYYKHHHDRWASVVGQPSIRGRERFLPTGKPLIRLKPVTMPSINAITY